MAADALGSHVTRTSVTMLLNIGCTGPNIPQRQISTACAILISGNYWERKSIFMIPKINP